MAACADSPICLAHNPFHCKPAATPFGEDFNRDKALPGQHLEPLPRHMTAIRSTAPRHCRVITGK
jgi:hypothetical protein